jgi:NADH-quinone oxidoreductase subunit D
MAKTRPISARYTDRLITLIHDEQLGFALSVESWQDRGPERAEYLRVILAELTRLQNHASLLGFLLSDMAPATTSVRVSRAREDSRSFESPSARAYVHYMRFGDADATRRRVGWSAKRRRSLPGFDEFEKLILKTKSSSRGRRTSATFL